MPRFILSLLIITFVSIMSITSAAPHHHDDPYSPVIDFLKQLRKARKNSGSIIGNREGEEGTLSTASSNQQQEQNPAPQSVPILFPQSNSGGGGGGGGGQDQRISIQLPSSFPTSHTPSSPADIKRVNSGVSTILNGVKSFDLGQILRGAFIFPRNENVKSVANTVLDTIFGAGGGGAAQN